MVKNSTFLDYREPFKAPITFQFHKFFSRIPYKYYVIFGQEDGALYYKKNGTERVLYEITALEFNISDEKYGYSDLLDASYSMDLLDMYKRTQVLKQFGEDCKNFFRMNIVDE